MPTIADYRNKFPSLRELDDAALIDRVAEVQGVSREDVIAHMGYKPKSRGILSFANDTVIEAANAAAGGVGSVANFVAPGNPVSQFIDENIIKAGEANQSDVVKAEKARYRAEMDAAEGIGDEIGSTLGYVARNPVQSLAQAAGSFVLPGAAVKGGGMLASMAGAGAKGATRAGLAGGAVAGAALSGGDAAGTAYELVKKAGGTDEEAAEAARKASVLPAAIGAAGGVIGAERLLAGAGGFGGGVLSRALKTAGVEGAQEAVEEGVTQYEGQAAAAPYDPTIDPLKGVAGAATMGAVLGGATGGAVSLLSGKPDEPKPDPVLKVLAAPDVDTAIKAAAEGLTGAKKAPPAELAQLDANDRREVLGLMQVVNRPGVSPNVARFAQARMDALLAPYRSIPTGEATEMLPVPDARELTDEERAEYANAAPFSYRRAMERGLPQPEVTELIPAGDATEVEPIPAGDAFEAIPAAEAYETLPVGEAAELIPTGDTYEQPARKLPVGKATELEAETIQADDLLARDGQPFGSKTGAQAKAYASGGGKVVAIPNHFGSGIPGYVVRPLMPGRPSNTRGTDARDLPRSSNVNQPDVAGTAGQPVADGAGRPDAAVGGKLAAGRVASDATGQQPGTAAAVAPGSAGNAPAGAGNAPDAALTGAAPELVKVRTVFGTNAYVRSSDLAGDDNGLVRMFTADGKNNGRIARGNLDQTGEKRAAAAKENADNPMFNVITRKGGGTFADQASAARELSMRGMGETHEVVPASEISPSATGYAIRKKPESAAPTFTEGQQVQLNGTPYTVTAANNTAVKLQGADGGIKMVARNSKTFGQIQPEAAPQVSGGFNVPEPPTMNYRLKKRGGQTYIVPPVGQSFSKETRTALRDWATAAGFFASSTGDNEISVSAMTGGPTLDYIVDGVEDQRIGRQVAKERAPTQEPNEAARPQAQAAAGEGTAPAAAPTGAPAATAVVPGTGGAAVQADGVKPRKTLQEARADAALDKQVRENGELMTRRQWVERKVAEGLKTKVTQEDRIKPMSRMAYFRANNEEQRAHDRRVKEAGKKDVYWIGDYEVTKTEHDYANALASPPNAEAPVQAAPRGAEAAPVAPAPEAAKYRVAAMVVGGKRDGQIIAKPEARIHAQLGLKADDYPGMQEFDLGFVDAAGKFYTRTALGMDASQYNAAVARGESPEPDEAQATYSPAALRAKQKREAPPAPERTPKAQAVKEALAAKKGAQPAPVATHKDPGEPAEPVTPAVVREAIKTGVQDTGRKPSAMKAELLAKIDAAMEAASSDEADERQLALARYPARKPTKDEVRTYMVQNRLNSLAAAEEKMVAERERSARNNAAAVAERIGYVTFSVPGDGVFKVVNTRDRLAEFRRKVEGSGGFKDRQSAPAPDRDGSEKGSGSKLAAFDNMVNEGDLEAASDYADAVGLELDPKKIANATKVLKWRETRTTEPAPAPAAEAPAAAPAPAADDRVLTIESGGSTQTLTLPKPAWQATDDELVQAVKDSGTYLGKPGSKYDPYRQWREAHSEAITKAARDGRKFPDELLYDKPALIRTDLNDDQADEASDAMVAEYRATKDYGKAVAVYREWGKKPATPAAQAPAGRDEQPEAQPLTLEAIPKTLQITLEVEDEGGKVQKKVVGARRAYLAAQQRVQKLQALKECVG